MIDPLSGGVVQFENRAQRNFCVAKPVVTEEVPVAIVEKAKVGVSSQNGDWKNTLESLNNLENEKNPTNTRRNAQRADRIKSYDVQGIPRSRSKWYPIPKHQ